MMSPWCTLVLLGLKGSILHTCVLLATVHASAFEDATAVRCKMSPSGVTDVPLVHMASGKMNKQATVLVNATRGVRSEAKASVWGILLTLKVKQLLLVLHSLV